MASSKKVDFLEKVLPQAAKLPGTSGFFKKKRSVSGKRSAPSSEAAQDKWLLIKKVDVLEKFCPRQRSCPGQVASSKRHDFLEEVLPQAAKLPGTSGLFKKKYLLRNSSAPGSEAARDKWLV